MLYSLLFIKKSIRLHIPIKITADSFFSIYLFIGKDPLYAPLLTTCSRLKTPTNQSITYTTHKACYQNVQEVPILPYHDRKKKQLNR